MASEPPVEGTVNSIEHRTRVFCQIAVQEFHLCTCCADAFTFFKHFIICSVVYMLLSDSCSLSSILENKKKQTMNFNLEGKRFLVTGAGGGRKIVLMIFLLTERYLCTPYDLCALQLYTTVDWQPLFGFKRKYFVSLS
jgi:hypothetical protein